MIGSIVTVTVDRPRGSRHPEYPNLYYPIPYGYVKGVPGGDGEDQDAYLLGVEEDREEFVGEVIAIIHRRNDVEDKWVVAPKGMRFGKEEILAETAFQEQYFEIEIET